MPFVWKDFKYDSTGKQVSFSSFKECFEQVLLPGGFLVSNPNNNNF
jgi:hypothetical protein